jgi:GntP family gluconate:H+ symporter
VTPAVHPAHLLACVAGAVVLLLLLVVRLRLHAALGLVLVALALGMASGMPIQQVPLSFTAGVGSMMGHIAIILAMGAILGQLLSDSTSLGEALVNRCGARGTSWALMALGLLVGMAVFFEVGLVLLFPLVVETARRTGKPPILTALPVMAGLSIMHGLVPPHPAAILATTAYHADVGRTILWAMVVGIPAAALAGPVLESILTRRWQKRGGGANATRQASPALAGPAPKPVSLGAASAGPAPARAWRALVVILLPVALICLGSWADALAGPATFTNHLLHLAGYPDVAMLIAALAALLLLGPHVQTTAYRARGGLRKLVADSFGPISGVIVILSAAGGLSGVLRDSGAAQATVGFATGAHIPPLLLAWLLAAVVRVSMGSATVAMAVASGVLAPLAGHMGANPVLMVLATGSGSLILSHVNDSGFWLVQSLFKVDVKSTLATWTIVETVVSISGLGCTLALAAVLR